MRTVSLLSWLVAVVLVPRAALPQEPAAVQPVRFAGTWVGTQAWNIDNPPPGSRNDQPVTLEIEVLDGRITGMMRPFLGGEDGATLVDAAIVGDELRATAVVGRPRTGGRRGGTGNWKDPIQVALVLKTDGLTMTGTADVKMGEVPWMKYKYELSKKRSRY